MRSSPADTFFALAPRIGASTEVRKQVRAAARLLERLAATNKAPEDVQEWRDELSARLAIAAGSAIELTALIVSPLRDDLEYSAFRAIVADAPPNDPRRISATSSVRRAVCVHNKVIDMGGFLEKPDARSLDNAYVWSMALFIGAAMASLAIDGVCRSILQTSADASKCDSQGGAVADGWTAYNFKRGCQMAVKPQRTQIAGALTALVQSAIVSAGMRRIIQEGLALGSTNGDSFIVPEPIAKYVEAVASKKFREVATIRRLASEQWQYGKD